MLPQKIADEDSFSVDEEAVVAAHVERFMNEEYPNDKAHVKTKRLENEVCPRKSKRDEWIDLIWNTPKSDWDIITKYCHGTMMYKFGLWLRKHPMPSFPKFEPHDPNAHKKKVGTK